MHAPLTILIIEDQNQDFLDVQAYTRQVCHGLNLVEGESWPHGFVIERARTRAEVEQALTAHEEAKTPLYLVFDVHMSKNDEDLDELIEAIVAQRDSYRGGRPVIIFTAVNNLKPVLRKPTKPHVYSIHKLRAKPGEDIRDHLRDALRSGIRSLLGKEKETA